MRMVPVRDLHTTAVSTLGFQGMIGRKRKDIPPNRALGDAQFRCQARRCITSPGDQDAHEFFAPFARVYGRSPPFRWHWMYPTGQTGHLLSGLRNLLREIAIWQTVSMPLTGVCRISIAPDAFVESEQGVRSRGVISEQIQKKKGRMTCSIKSSHPAIRWSPFRPPLLRVVAVSQDFQVERFLQGNARQGPRLLRPLLMPSSQAIDAARSDMFLSPYHAIWLFGADLSGFEPGY